MTSNHTRPGPVVFAVATAPERRGIEKALRAPASMPAPTVLQTGIGPLDIDTLVHRLARDELRGLISIGTCGGLSPQAAPGALLLPATILRNGAPDMKVDPSWRSQIYDALQAKTEVLAGSLITVDRVLRTPAAKQRIHQESGAVGTDMESADLLRVAERLNIPFVTLRVVLDSHDETIPTSVAAGVDPAGNPTPLDLLRTVSAHPGDIPGLYRLAMRLRSVNAVLGNALALTRHLLLPP